MGACPRNSLRHGAVHPSTVPTYHAAEVLLFFASHRDRSFSPEEIVVEMRPVVIALPAVKEYARLFAARQLIIETEVPIDTAPRLKWNLASASWPTPGSDRSLTRSI